MRIISPYTHPQNWLKGNFHTHTNVSDGEDNTKAVIEAYRDDNYDFLAITDHGVLSGGRTKKAGRMLLLPAQECHVRADSGAFDYHVVGLGLKKQVAGQTSGQGIIDAISNNGGLAFVSHPRWSFMEYEQFNRLTGYVGFEVYNGVCDKWFGRGYSNDFWDGWMTERREAVYAVAVDDTHALRRDFASGWTMVNAKKTPAAIYDALRRGDAYSSTGPRIETIRVENGTIHAHTSSAKAIKFVSTDGHIAFQVEGEHVKSAAFCPKGDEVYVRVEVHGHDGTIAWSNPFFIEGD